MKLNKLILSGAAIGLSIFGAAGAAVDVSPFRIEETRTLALAKDSMGYSIARLNLTLSIKGPESQNAVRYGNLHLDEAADDQGTNLIPRKDQFNNDTKFKEYSNAFFRKSDLQRRKAADPQIEIDLGLPKRSATKIAHLRGSFELAEAGTIKTVEVPDIAAPGTKKLDLPADAGVQVSTTVKATSKTSISLEITGDENAIESIEVLDGSGTAISNGISSWNFNGGPAHKSLDVQKPLDSTMKLVVKIAVDRKITKVPFDLKDIQLP